MCANDEQNKYKLKSENHLNESKWLNSDRMWNLTVLGEFLAFKNLGKNGLGDPDVCLHEMQQQSPLIIAG